MCRNADEVRDQLCAKRQLFGNRCRDRDPLREDAGPFIEPLVEANRKRGALPGMEGGSHGNAEQLRNNPTDQPGLVAVGMQHFRSRAPQPIPQALDAPVEHREGQALAGKLAVKRVRPVIGQEQDMGILPAARRLAARVATWVSMPPRPEESRNRTIGIFSDGSIEQRHPLRPNSGCCATDAAQTARSGAPHARFPRQKAENRRHSRQSRQVLRRIRSEGGGRLPIPHGACGFAFETISVASAMAAIVIASTAEPEPISAGAQSTMMES